MYAEPSSAAHQRDNLHPIARLQKMLDVLLPGDQLQVDFDRQRFAGKPQLFEQRSQRGSLGNLARLTVDGYFNASIHRLVGTLMPNSRAFCARFYNTSGRLRSVVAVRSVLTGATATGRYSWPPEASLPVGHSARTSGCLRPQAASGRRAAAAETAQQCTSGLAKPQVAADRPEDGLIRATNTTVLAYDKTTTSTGEIATSTTTGSCGVAT